MQKDYIFFDLDGTLTDSQEGIKAALRVMLEHFDMKLSDSELMKFIGPALWESCPKYLGFSHEKTEEAISVFRDFYREKGIFINKVYDGVFEMLETLKKAGKKLVLATGKPEEQAKIVVNHFNLAKYFDFIGGSTFDESRAKKSQVIEYAMKNCGLTSADTSKIIMIGDRENDISGAHKNGIEVIAVLYGYGNKQEFTEAGADYICETTKDICNLILG